MSLFPSRERNGGTKDETVSTDVSAQLKLTLREKQAWFWGISSLLS